MMDLNYFNMLIHTPENKNNGNMLDRTTQICICILLLQRRDTQDISSKQKIANTVVHPLSFVDRGIRKH